MNWEEWVKETRNYIFQYGVVFTGSDEVLRPYFDMGYPATNAAQAYVDEINIGKPR